jgi:hypothetical protein
VIYDKEYMCKISNSKPLGDGAKNKRITDTALYQYKKNYRAYFSSQASQIAQGGSKNRRNRRAPGRVN